MKFLYLSAIVLTFLFTNSAAQLPYGYKPQNAATSPTVSALSQQVNQDLNLYSGVANISIPLFELNENQVSLPVSLNYNTGGIRVKEKGGWLGLGWNLNCGGVITRKVNGGPDEGGVGGIGFKQLNGHQQIFPDLMKDEVWENVDETLSYRASVMKNFEGNGASGIATFVPDYAPDEFTYNFLGQSGTFIFDKSGNVISDRKVKINFNESAKVTYNTEGETRTSGIFNSIQIITEDGYIYDFTQLEETYTNSIYYHHNYLDALMAGADIRSDAHPVYNSWFLTKVSSPDGIHEIEFIYSSDDRLGKNVFYDYALDEKVTNGTYLAEVSTTKITPITLKEIRTPNFLCDFTYSNHLKNNHNLVLIDIKKRNGEYIKSFYFDYKAVDEHRTLLTDVKEFHRPSGDYVLNYSFEYNEQPINYYEDGIRNSTSGSDFWGYYNGEHTAYNSLIVGLSKPAHVRNPLAWWDKDRPARVGIDTREPNINYAQANSLKKIINPLGGFKELTYEANTYSYINNLSTLSIPKMGGGLRIKQIIDSDGMDMSKNIIRTYEYNDPNNPTLSNGVIENEPLLQYTFQSNNYEFGQPVLPISIGYSFVTEILNDGSKIVHHYTTTKDYPYTPYPEDATFYLPTEPGEFNGSSPTYSSIYPLAIVGQVYYVQNEASGGPAQIYRYERVFSQKANHIFKDFSGLNSHLRGLLKEQWIYNSQNQLVSSESNTYSSKEIGKVFSMSYKQLGGKSVVNPETLNSGSTSTISTSEIFTFLQHFYKSINITQLSSSVKKTYGSQNDLNFIENQINYTYNQKNNQLFKVSTQASNGNLIEKVTSYSIDYEGSSNNGIIESLVSKNMINHVIEERTIFNNKVTAGTVKLYNTSGKIMDLYQLETTKPLSSSLFQPIDPYSKQVFALNSNYIPKFHYKYGLNHNQLEEEQKVDGVTVSTLWNQNATKPIAQIYNSSVNTSLVTEENFQTWSGLIENPRDFFDLNLTNNGLLKFRINLSNTTEDPKEDNFEFIIRNKLTNSIVFQRFYRVGNRLLNIELDKGEYTVSCDYFSESEIKKPFALVLEVDKISEKQNSFYTSFEDKVDEFISISSKTGTKSYRGSFGIPLPHENGQYILSYFEKLDSEDEWIKKEENITIPLQEKIIGSENSLIDEVRLYKSGSFISSFTYGQIDNLLSENNISGQITTYSYDNLNRLNIVRNSDNEIIKYVNYSKKNGVNIRPIISNLPSVLTFRVGEVSDYQISQEDIFDLDGSISNIEVIGNLPQGVSLENENGTFRFRTISSTIEGHFEFKVRVTDNLGATNETILTIEIINATGGYFQLWKSGTANERVFLRTIDENNLSIKISDYAQYGQLNLFTDDFYPKVKFTLTKPDNSTIIKEDNQKPFGLFGDNGGFTPTIGQYSLKIQYYRVVDRVPVLLTPIYGLNHEITRTFSFVP